MEVPRHWRLKKQRYNPNGEECLNCGDRSMAIGRPVCRECGIVYKPEMVEVGVDSKRRFHRVMGKSFRVVFADEIPVDERAIEVRWTEEIRVRTTV